MMLLKNSRILILTLWPQTWERGVWKDVQNQWYLLPILKVLSRQITSSKKDYHQTPILYKYRNTDSILEKNITITRVSVRWKEAMYYLMKVFKQELGNSPFPPPLSVRLGKLQKWFLYWLVIHWSLAVAIQMLGLIHQ